MVQRLVVLLLTVNLLAACASSPTPTATPEAPPAQSSDTPLAATPTLTPTEIPPTEPPQPASAPVIYVSPAGRGAAQVWPINAPVENPRALNGLRTLGAARDRVLYGVDMLSGKPQALTAGQAARPLDFMADANYGFDVRPTGDAWLGWATYPTAEQPTRLWLARPDGSELSAVFERPTDGQPITLVFDRWAADGLSFFFSQEPYGIGGYMPVAGASSLYRMWLADSRLDVLVPFPASGTGRSLCIDDLYEPTMVLAHHCDDPAEIKLTNLATGASVRLARPEPTDRVGPDGLQVGNAQRAGTARFSPDGSRVAYALILGDPGAEQGWVAVADAQTGASELAWAAAPGGLFQVIGWLNSQTLLLQYSSPAGSPPAVWQVAANGAEGYAVAGGSWIGLAP